MELENTIIAITGAASGMGAATAKHFAAKGAKVALLDINTEVLEKTAKLLGNHSFAFPCDVTDESSVKNALTQIQAKLKNTPRILVNCAGVVHSQRILGREAVMPLAEFERVMRINVMGTFNVMRLFAESMSKCDVLFDTQERGVIINTSSVAAYEGQIGQAAYSASKGAIVSMTLPAAREFAQFGIRVMTIAPGLVATPMFEALTPEARASLAQQVPFPKRLAKPEEFAMLCEQIVQNPMLNGTVIRLDGALRMQAK